MKVLGEVRRVTKFPGGYYIKIKLFMRFLLLYLGPFLLVFLPVLFIENMKIGEKKLKENMRKKKKEKRNI